MSYTTSVRSLLLHTDVKRKCCLETELFLYSCILRGSGGIFADGDLFSRLSYIESRLLKDRSSGDAGGFLADCEERNGAAGRQKFALNIDAVDSYFRPKSFGDPAGMDGFIVKECCAGAAMRAVFAIAGSISPPENPSCYMEFYFADSEVAEGFRRLLANSGIKASVTKRRQRFVCYVKKAETICDALTMMALPGESIKFQMAKTEREVSNSVNRVLNCDMANIDRASERGMAEAEAIRLLDSRNYMQRLPDDLVRLAELRIQNPEVSHGELGRMMVPELSHSSVSLKMKKILAIAESLK